MNEPATVVAIVSQSIERQGGSITRPALTESN